MITLNEARVVAYNWHGGQESSLYSFASTGAIHSEEHRRDTLTEIDQSAGWTNNHLSAHPGDLEYTREPDRLKKLREFVEKVDLGGGNSGRIPDDVWTEWSRPDDGNGFDTFTQAYVTAALWSSTDDNGDPLDAKYTSEDLAEETVTAIKADCLRFRREFSDLLTQATDTKLGYDEAQAGHDFWLTRAGHGVGFWDRGLGEVGQKLTEACKGFGEITPVVGDDGKIHFE